MQVFETSTVEKDSSGSAVTALSNLRPNSPPPGYVESNLASMYVSAVENPASCQETGSQASFIAGTKQEVSFCNSKYYIVELVLWVSPTLVPVLWSNSQLLTFQPSLLSSQELNNTPMDEHSYEDLRLDLMDREDLYGDYHDGIHGQNSPSSSNHWVWLAAGSCYIDNGGRSAMGVIGTVGSIAGPAHWFVESSNGGSTVISQSSLAGENWRINILNVRHLNVYMET